MKNIIAAVAAFLSIDSYAHGVGAMCPHHISGVVTPLITPLTATGDLDIKSLDRLIDHVVDQGVSAVMVLGTTGEGANLSARIQEDLIRETCRRNEQIDRRVPVLVNVSANALDQVFTLMSYAEKYGASAIVLSPPSYFALTPAEMSSYVKAVSDHSHLPIFLYNIPSQVHQALPVSVVVEAAAHSNVIGIKDSSGDLDYLRDLMAALKPYPAFTVLVGSESKMRESLDLGARGVVSGGSNVSAKIFVALFKANEARDLAAIEKATAAVLDWKKRADSISESPNAAIKVFKLFLHAMGVIDSPNLAAPLGLLNDEESKLLLTQMRKLNLITVP